MRTKECSPATIGKYPNLSKALKKGQTIHGFRSGGGLRVVRLHDKGKLHAYGEHPYVYNALEHAEADCKAGGRKYDKVYGKIYDHYLTGAEAQGGFDSWVAMGRGFDFLFLNEKFVFKSKYSSRRKVPKEIEEQVKSSKKTVLWKADGLEFESKLHPYANGEFGVMTGCITETEDDVWFLKKEVCLEADTLHDLIVLLDKEFSESDKWS